MKVAKGVSTRVLAEEEMTQSDWWLGVLVLGLILLVHAAIPRYICQRSRSMWAGSFVSEGRWASVADQIDNAEAVLDA